MKRHLIIISGFFLMLISAHAIAQDVDREAMEITLYANGFGIVHDKREIELERGITEINIAGIPRDIRPETVNGKFDGRILDQNFSFQESHWPEAIYKQLKGEHIILISEGGHLVEGRLHSYKHGQIWLEDEDGSFVFIPNTHSYRLQTGLDPEVLTLESGLNWTVETENSGMHDVSIYYQVNNIRWSADYNMMISENEESMTLEAKATINNHSGMDYPEARVRLVAGDINILRQDHPQYRGAMGGPEMMMQDSDISPQELGDYYVFELPERILISDQAQRQVTLRRAEDVQVKKHYKYQTGSMGQVRRNNNAVTAEYRMANTEEFKLGTPLPAGLVKVYKKAGELMELIGEDRLDHTAVGQDFTIEVGGVFDIDIEEKQIRLDNLSNRVWEEDREIHITNQKDQEVMIEVELQLQQNEELRSSSIEPREIEARRYIFEVSVGAESKIILSFQLRRSN
ncbi:MAG: DUF4139 domain-containing protein [Balneolales bacterium]